MSTHAACHGLAIPVLFFTDRLGTVGKVSPCLDDLTEN